MEKTPSKNSFTKGRFIKNSLRIITQTEKDNKNQNSHETKIRNIEDSSNGFSVSLTVYSNDGGLGDNERNFLNITVSDN